jgi:hypothetical protein
LVGGGAGVYFGTHDQPGFCNFICHTPMDPYVASYNDGTSILPIQAEAQAEAAQAGTPIVLSVTLHKESDQQLNCLDCHEPTMSEQITEGIKWISGDYSVPLAGFEVVPSTPREGQKAAEEFCLREGCHEGIASLEDLKKATADEHRNPHNSHNGDQACTKCHQTHEQSVMWCTQCHGDSTVPDGWLTYQEQQSQQKKAEEAAAAAGA